MKNHFYIILILFVPLLSSCRKEQITQVVVAQKYDTKNFFHFSPDESILWDDHEDQKVSVVLENVDLVTDFNLIHKTIPKGKNPTVGWHREKQRADQKIVDVPITNIKLLAFAVSKENAIDWVTPDFPWPDPIEDYLQKVEVYIRGDAHAVGDYNATYLAPDRSELLASCEIDSCGQEGYLTEEEIKLYTDNYTGDHYFFLKPTYYNMVNFIEVYPDYWIEVVGTYRSAPTQTRYIKYNAIFQASGTHIGK